MDVAGDNQVDIENSLFKQRIAVGGGLIGLKRNEGIGKVILLNYQYKS
jgi:hypothetical protein